MDSIFEQFFLKAGLAAMNRNLIFDCFFANLWLRCNIHHPKGIAFLLFPSEPVLNVESFIFMVFNVWVEFMVVLFKCWDVVDLSKMEIFVWSTIVGHNMSAFGFCGWGVEMGTGAIFFFWIRSLTDKVGAVCLIELICHLNDGLLFLPFLPVFVKCWMIVALVIGSVLPVDHPCPEGLIDIFEKFTSELQSGITRRRICFQFKLVVLIHFLFFLFNSINLFSFGQLSLLNIEDDFL